MLYIQQRDFRTDYTQEHMDQCQAIFAEWQRALKGNTTWERVNRLAATGLAFIANNKRQFPNARYHLRSWDVMYQVSLYHIVNP